MVDKEENWFLSGLFVGLILMSIIWMFTAQFVEKSKVSAGYLTFENKTYKVVLYDTLDVPELDEKVE